MTISFIFLSLLMAKAQQPVITNIDPLSTFPFTRLAISGSGFGTDPGQVVVRFGAVKGTITSVADHLITVTVPPQATSGNVTVINLASGLATQSTDEFYPVFSGSDFNPSLVTTPVVVSDQKQVYDPCVCDLDNDGLPDVVYSKFENATQLLVLLNQSTPENLSFVALQLNIGQPTVNIRCGDLNGDGLPDLYMSRGGTSRFNIFVLPNNSSPGSLSFGTMQILPMDTDVTSRRVAHKDLNNDGKPEIVVTNSASPEVIIFENTSSSGTISFNSTPIVIEVAGASRTSGLDVQDIDGDNRPDIIVCQFFANHVFVLRNTSVDNISFDAAHQLTLAGNPLLNLTTGDFDGDRLIDIAATASSDNKVFVFHNNSTPGNINFNEVESFAVNDGPWGISTGDVDGDGQLDMVTTSIGGDNFTVLRNESDGETLSFSRLNVSAGKKTRNVSVNDLDGDGKPDFALSAFDASNNFDARVIRNTNCYYPQILNEQPLAICSSQTITLSTPYSAGVNYSWTKDGDPTVLGSGSTLDITTFGTYQVEAVSESEGCATTTSVVVADGNGTVPGDPVASNSGPVCRGGDLTLSANTVSGATYRWTGPDNFTSSEQNPVISNITDVVAGIYAVTIKVGDCQSSTAETTVEIVSVPEFTIDISGLTEVCAGNTIALSTQSRTGFSYQWRKDGNAIAGETNTAYTATVSGTYDVAINDDNSSCEIFTNEVEVNIYAAPVADFTMAGGTCMGDEITFTNSSTVDGSATVEYSWTLGDGATATGENATHTYPSSGDYTVQLTASYPGVAGCTDNQSKTATVNAPTVPVISSTETTICEGEEIELSISGTFDAVLWSTGETTNSITISEPGTYGVEVTDVNGCESSAEIVIEELPIPTVQVTADETDILMGDEVQMEASGADTYSWAPEASLSDPGIANPVAQPEQTTTYIVTGTITDGCSATAEITINVSEGNDVNIVPLKAFSPKSAINPTWEIENVENYPDCTLSIFDERGALVYRQKGYDNTWNATYDGGILPGGVYYYVFGCEGFKPKTGTVVVVR